MNDSRLCDYRRALCSLVEGVYPTTLPVGDDDDVGQLGSAILRLSHSLERRFDELKKLLQVTEQTNSGLLVDEILDELYSSFRGLIPYNRIGLALLEAQGRVLFSRWARSDAETIHINRGYTASIEGSSLEQILHTGKPRILNDLKAYLAEHPNSESTELMVKEGVRSSLTCPLLALGKPIGFLFFSSFVEHTYCETHVGLFMQIAKQLSTIVEKARLYEELKRVNLELHETQQRLQFLMSHDALTGLRNRYTLDDYMQREWGRASRYRKPLSALMIDIDQFKAYNDVHGHLAGDHCLKSVAQVIQQQASRSADFAGRYGGEEFLAILPDTDCQGAFECANRMRERVESLKIRRGKAFDSAIVTISVGVATTTPTLRSSPMALISAADEALFVAKESGRNRVAVNSSLDRIACLEDPSERVGVMM